MSKAPISIEYELPELRPFLNVRYVGRRRHSVTIHCIEHFFKVLYILIKYIGEDIKRADLFKRFPFFVPFIYLYTFSEDVADHLKESAYGFDLRAYYRLECHFRHGRDASSRALQRVKDQIVDRFWTANRMRDRKRLCAALFKVFPN
jgi:hypothetical protein